MAPVLCCMSITVQRTWIFNTKNNYTTKVPWSQSLNLHSWAVNSLFVDRISIDQQCKPPAPKSTLKKTKFQSQTQVLDESIPGHLKIVCSAVLAGNVHWFDNRMDPSEQGLGSDLSLRCIHDMQGSVSASRELPHTAFCALWWSKFQNTTRRFKTRNRSEFFSNILYAWAKNGMLWVPT